MPGQEDTDHTVGISREINLKPPRLFRQVDIDLKRRHRSWNAHAHQPAPAKSNHIKIKVPLTPKNDHPHPLTHSHREKREKRINNSHILERMTLFRRSLSLSTGGQTLSLDLNAAAPSCAKYFVGTRIKKAKIKSNENKKKTYQKRKCVSRDKEETLLTLHFGYKISAKELMIATFLRVCKKCSRSGRREILFKIWR